MTRPPVFVPRLRLAPKIFATVKTHTLQISNVYTSSARPAILAFSMAKALHKIQKQVAKKRGGKPDSLHENSRDAKRLRRAGQREEKLARHRAAREKVHEGYREYAMQ